MSTCLFSDRDKEGAVSACDIVAGGDIEGDPSEGSQVSELV